ncbi:hypothetical protein L3X38_029517 [Prunus dulcis]|uniref:Response regulatory domain-containing protein n=1 Tax=Prunus dulcis TaxID=3755 RepID=A0AAD4VRS4_PRUDU|nr:hypothetical protein L3X38_029517 [Prunus dulcis]
MESKELNLKKHSEHGGGGGGGGDGFIDRSKVRILLCDNDEHSSEEVFALLMKCSYQVISVRSPRQVTDALNAEAPDIDIILAEVDLPMRKGLKMLKYITRDRELRRIPVIIEYSVVSKLDVGNCRTSINLGVVLVDYFVRFFSCLLLFIFHSQLVDASAQQVVSELQFFDWGFVGVKNLSVLQ